MNPSYAQEEEFFYKLNRELIDRNRMEQDRRMRLAHVIKCPKCDQLMKEHQISNIKFNRCLQCQGVFFNASEFETLQASREHSRFFNLIKKLFEVREQNAVLF